VLLPPRDPATVETLVVALHGHGSHQEQFLTPSIFGDALGAAVRLAQAENLLYVAPEYRGNSWMNASARWRARKKSRLRSASLCQPMLSKNWMIGALSEPIGG
jgi:poly(3-hydroxybutyrate) depolymerase